jgi:hypothetical protein
MFCTRCGTKNPDNSAHCYNCGQNMATAPDRPPQATPSVPSQPSNSKGIQLADSSGYSVLATLASDAQHVRIQIESSQIGMKGEKKEEFVISGGKGKYVARGKTVEPCAIEVLLTALDEPRVKAPSIQNCGVDPAILLSNYEAQLREYLSGSTTGFLHDQSPGALEFYKRQFADSLLAQEALTKSFNYEMTGSFREINVTVTVDGNHFDVSSASQHLFFLPWKGPDHERGGFNCHISRALAAILPTDFSNRESLVPTDECFRRSIIDHALPIIEKRWKSRLPEQPMKNCTIPTK